MEARLIKTCHGLVEIRFHDGALLPPNVGMVDLCEAWHQEAMEIEWAMAHFASKRLPKNRTDFLDLRYWQLPASTQQHPTD